MYTRDFQKRLHTLDPTVAVERSANIRAGKVEFGAEVISTSYVGLKVSTERGHFGHFPRKDGPI